MSEQRKRLHEQSPEDRATLMIAMMEEGLYPDGLPPEWDQLQEEIAERSKEKEKQNQADAEAALDPEIIELTAIEKKEEQVGPNYDPHRCSPMDDEDMCPTVIAEIKQIHASRRAHPAGDLHRNVDPPPAEQPRPPPLFGENIAILAQALAAALDALIDVAAPQQPSQQEIEIFASAGQPLKAEVIAAPGQPLEEELIAAAGKPAALEEVAAPGQPVEGESIADAGKPAALEKVAAPGQHVEGESIADAGKPAALEKVAAPGQHVEGESIADAGKPAALEKVAAPGQHVEGESITDAGKPAALEKVAAPGQHVEGKLIAAAGQQPHAAG